MDGGPRQAVKKKDVITPKKIKTRRQNKRRGAKALS